MQINRQAQQQLGGQATEEEMKRLALMQIMSQGAPPQAGPRGSVPAPVPQGGPPQGGPPVAPQGIPGQLPGAGTGAQISDEERKRFLEAMARRGK